MISRHGSKWILWIVCLGALSCASPTPEWERSNLVVPLPAAPLGIDSRFDELPVPPTPERVRLGRWLFYDPRLSADGTISCATCHRPEHAFSEPLPVSIGIDGQRGRRKAPPILNLAWTLYPHFFWDGRAASLEEQALGPIENPIEMGSTHVLMLRTLEGIAGYRPYFAQAFGTQEITRQRVVHAIADYERTRMSGNSPWDRWRDGDEAAVAESVKRGHELFFGKAACNQCHLGQNFTDHLFHNLGIGWNEAERAFADSGRAEVSGKADDVGAFKTPTLRDVTLHAPYMHDGSIATLREAVEHYNQGGIANPNLSPKITALGLTPDEVDDLLAFLQALDGEGYQDTPPAAFPQ